MAWDLLVCIWDDMRFAGKMMWSHGLVWSSIVWCSDIEHVVMWYNLNVACWCGDVIL